MPSPPGAAAHAAGPLWGRCGLFLSSSLRSPFLPRVTGGKGEKKCGFVRALRPPPRQTGSGRGVWTVRAAGGLGPSLARWVRGAVPRPQGRVGWVLRGRWLMGPQAPAAPPRCPVLEMALREGKCQPRCQSLPVASFHPRSPLPLPERLWLEKVAPGAR